VEDTSPALQVKLLRVLQEQSFERAGSTKNLRIDVRIIATTNRNLEEAIARGEFREDLYYRLSVI
jgi:transcriptional regulator with PAS, ATPase and Fis domain